MEISSSLKNFRVNQHFQRPRQAEGGDGTYSIACDFQNLGLASHCHAGLTQMLAQPLPRNLLRTSHQSHNIVPFSQTEYNAANNLLRSLCSFLRGLFQGCNLPGMPKDAMRDAAFFQSAAGGGSVIHEVSFKSSDAKMFASIYDLVFGW